jgi:hypothetical protein
MSNVTHITRKMSRQAFLKQREHARVHGFEFVLPDATKDNDDEPFTIRVRRLSLDEKAAVNGITQTMQDQVYQRTRQMVDWIADQEKRKTKPSDQLQALQESKSLRDAVNAVCVAAWIDPVLVETDAELAQNSDAWLVDDFSVSDRWDAFQAITNSSSKEAKSLKLFRPESGDDVADSGTVQDAPAAKRGLTAS